MPHTQHCPKCSKAVPAGSRFCQACGSTMTPGKQKKPAARRPGSGKTKTYFAGALILVLIVGGVLFGLNRSPKQHSAAATIPDHQTHVQLAGQMPQWLVSAPSDVNDDYAWAAAHHDELQYFPCFCGCDKSAGHISNSECYYARDAKGAVKAYDKHAYG